MQTLASLDRRRMYGDLAWTWPIVSPPDDYIEETEEFVKLIRKHSKIPVNSVVNFGCGGGHNDFTLKKHFAVTGVDISQSMLGLARELNPENMYLHGDMRSVRLGRLYDAVTVFDAINYMRSADSLKAAFMTAFSHLKSGGVFLTNVEETKERFKQNKTKCSSHSLGDLEITLLENYYDSDPDDTWYESNFIYLIRRAGELQMETDSHILGLFSFDQWLELMGEVGFRVKKIRSAVPDQEGNLIPTLVGIKP